MPPRRELMIAIESSLLLVRFALDYPVSVRFRQGRVAAGSRAVGRHIANARSICSSHEAVAGQLRLFIHTAARTFRRRLDCPKRPFRERRVSGGSIGDNRHSNIGGS
jgi:hypothetical protein